MLVTALPRVRGVAPMTFVGLLVFSLAPLGGVAADPRLGEDAERAANWC